MHRKFFIIIFFFSLSCTGNYNIFERKGFAKINNQNKILSSFPKGTLFKITNLKTKDSNIIITDERVDNLGSRIISLPVNVYKDLNINKDLPLISLQTYRKNKIFIAKKVKMFEEEKKIENKVKLEKIKIYNLKNKNNATDKIYLNFGPFYYMSYAIQLYGVLNKRIINKNMISKDYRDKNYLVTVGPINNLYEYDKIYLKLRKIGLIGFDIKIQ